MRQALAVVDASVLTEVLAAPGRARGARQLLRRYRLTAPAHFDAEVLNALFGLARAGRMSEEWLQRAVRSLGRFPARRVPSARLLADAPTLRHNLSAYDALYVALGRRLGCPLITADRRLTRAPRLGVELVLAP